MIKVFRFGWPFLLAPLVAGAVYLLRDAPFRDQIRTHDNTLIPVGLPLAAAVIAFSAGLFRRLPLAWLVAVGALVFFLREAHMPGSTAHLPGIKTGIYIAIPLLLIWGFVWRERLNTLQRFPFVGVWIAAIFWTYGFSQLIARGGLKKYSEVLNAQGLDMRTPMEESCETLGHTMLLLLAMMCLFVGRRSSAVKQQLTATSAVKI